MNNKYLVDTMALILRLEKRKMPKKVKDKFIQAEKGESEIVIPAMAFAELAYLSESKRIDTTLGEAEKYLAQYPSVMECPMTLSTIKEAFAIDDVPELHNRLIAASGKKLGIPVLTNDPDIRRPAMSKASGTVSSFSITLQAVPNSQPVYMSTARPPM